jgi:hypothetical protein
MNIEPIDFRHLDGPTLPWQCCAPKLSGQLSFQFSHAAFLGEEHEEALADLAERLSALFDLPFSF